MDVLLDAFALRFTEGYVAAAAVLARALKLVLAINAGADLEAGRWLWLSQPARPGLARRPGHRPAALAPRASLCPQPRQPAAWPTGP